MPAEEQPGQRLQDRPPPIVLELQPGVELVYDDHQLLRVRPIPLNPNVPGYDRLIRIAKYASCLDTTGLSYEQRVEVVRRLRAIFDEDPAPPAALQPDEPQDSLQRDIHHWQLLHRKLSVIRGGFTCLAYFAAVYVAGRVFTAPSELFRELMIGSWGGLVGVLGVLLGLLLKSPSEEQLQVAGRDVAYKAGLIQALFGGLLGVVLGATVSYFLAIPPTPVEPVVVPSAQSAAASQAAQTLVRRLVLSVTMTMAIIFGFLVSIKADLLIIPERPPK